VACFGDLAVRSETNNEAAAVHFDNTCCHYCRLHLKREKNLYTRKKPGLSGHISRVKTYSRIAATTCLADHLLTVDEVDFRENCISGTSEPVGLRCQLMRDVF